jgi:UDP-GlcNAc:undecaprenyl-phosphate GlcNAc-1-phosphate transferase
MIYLVILFFLNFFIFKNYLIISKLYKLYDYPDKLRKTHLSPTPLLGGLIIYINLICLFIILFFFETQSDYFTTKSELIIFFTFCSLFFFLGFMDDKYQLSANVKLLFTSLFIFILMIVDQNIIIREISFSFTNFILNFRSFDYFVTILCFLLFINSFNMIDGINGQSVSYSLFIIIIFIIFKINVIFFILFLVPLCFFLFTNLKGKMFLGDSGTMLISFIISYFFIKSYNLQSKFFSDEIFLIMMIPGFELLRLAITRIFKKKHPFNPDRNHIHHYMIKKYDFPKSFLFVQLFLVLPFLSYMLISNSIVVLFIFLAVYICTIVYLSNK